MPTYDFQGVEHPEEENPRSTSGEVTYTEHPLTKLKLHYKAKLPIKFPHSPGYKSEKCRGCASGHHEPEAPFLQLTSAPAPLELLGIRPTARARNPVSPRCRGQAVLLLPAG